MGVITDRERRELHERAEAALGKKAADTLMAHLPPVGWAEVATKTDLRLLAAEIVAQVNEKIAELDKKISQLREQMQKQNGEIREQMQKQNGEIREEMQRIRAEMGHMRADLTRSHWRSTVWLVLAVSTMPQVVAEILSRF